MAKHMLIVFSNAVEGRDAEFNEWYDNTHLNEVLSVPGMVAAQRFRIADTQFAEKPKHRYFSLYEIETDNLQDTAKAFLEMAPKMTPSPSLDAKGAWPILVTAIGPRRLKKA